MVKGVNKTVIEVNDTGSRLFEKIVFYVTPEYGTLSAKQLKKAASSFSFNFEDVKRKKTLRNIVKKKKILKATCISSLVLIVSVGVLLFVL